MITFTDYRKAYGKTAPAVLQIAALSLPKGIYCLRGGNGSGKTTLLRSIASLVPFDGKILVNDLDCRRDRMAYRKAVGFSEAEPLYPGFLTGHDLIRFYQETKGAPAGQLEDMKAALGIDLYEHSKTDTYSTGMTKKLSLMLAFTGRPEWVLLDEPFITLDAEAMVCIMALIRQKAAEGKGILISSHGHEMEGPDALGTTALAIENKTLIIRSHA